MASIEQFDFNYKRRLGLDLGTNSIGWCLLDCDEKHDKYDIVDLGVRLWSSGMSKEDRRKYRLARRQRRYKKSHLKQLKDILDPILPFQNKLERTHLHPFNLRMKALDAPLEPKELRTVLFHIAKNRGFRGSEEDTEQQEKEHKGFKKTISQTEKEVKEQARTYGEWLVETKRPKLRLRGEQKPDHYPTRPLIEDEFDKIRVVQESHFPNLDWNRVREVIFFQRDLLDPIVGRCSVYPDEKRMPKNNPLAFEFVMLQTLSNITLLSTSDGTTRRLNRQEIHEAQNICGSQKTMKYTQLLKRLHLNNEYEVRYKNTDKEKPEVPGLQAKPQGYLGLSCKAVEEILKQFWASQDETIGAIKYRLEEAETEKQEAQEYLEYYGKSMKNAPNFYVIPSCRCENLDTCPHSISPEEKQYGRTPNGVHHVAYNQLRTLINAIIQRYGPIDEISVELIRNEWDPPKNQKIRNQNEERNNEVRKRIKDASKSLTHENMTKGKLFMEMEKEGCCICCPFCPKSFGWDTLFSPEVQIEHILPKSQTKSNDFKYLTLSCVNCNNTKNARTPYEAFGSRSDYDQMIQRVPLLKRWMFQSDAIERFKELTDGFLPRSLADTSGIAKHARRYLQPIAKKIWATRGGLTADLRRHLDLKKDRKQNLTHHALDAFVIALISPSLLQKLSRSRYDWANAKFEQPLFADENKLAEQVTEKLKNIVVSQKLNHSLQGAILAETAYGVYPNEPERKYRGWSPSAKKNKKREERGAHLDTMEIVGIPSGISATGAALEIKAYESAEYAYVDLWQNLDNKKIYIFTFTTLRNALDIRAGKKSFCQPQGEKGRWRKIIRLRKGDYLQDKEKRIFRVHQLDNSNDRIFLSHPNVANLKKAKAPDLISCKAFPFIKQGWHPAHVDTLGHVKARLPKQS